MKAIKNFAVMWRKKELVQRNINQALQGYNLSSTAKDIYIFTAAAHSTCITNIVHHSYFGDKSLSTIKRVTTDWTRPADLDPGSLVHKIGDMLNPTK